MPTVLREAGFTVRVFGPPREHAPPHVHVEHGPDGLVVIRLGGRGRPPSIRAVYRVRSGVVLRAYRLVERHHERILSAWEALHGEARNL